MRCFNRGLSLRKDTRCKEDSRQFSQWVKDPGASGSRRKNKRRRKNAPGREREGERMCACQAHLNSYHSLSAPWRTLISPLSSRRNRARSLGRKEKEREGEREKMRSLKGKRCAREDEQTMWEERGKREQPGWRHGGTGSAKRDGNMRDTLRSPTVRLIRSGFAVCVHTCRSRAPRRSVLRMPPSYAH